MYDTPAAVVEKATFALGPQTFEEEVLNSLWKEPYMFETHTRETLQAALAKRSEKATAAAAAEAAKL